MARHVDVRLHVAVGLALGALAAASALAPALGSPVPAPDAHVPLALASLTLLAEALAFWYVPSFAKRSLVAPAVAQHAGPWLLGLGALAAALGGPLDAAAAVAFALALASFGAILLMSGLRGEPWRGGVPFWRTEGGHRAGDSAAVFALASGAAAFLVAGALLALLPLRSTAPTIAWLAALALFALGGLAHLVPRSRGAPLAAGPLRAGVALVDAGALLAVLVFLAPLPLGAPAALVLGAGVVLAVGSLARPAPEAKPRGPRARDARPFALAASLLALAAAFLVVLGFPDRADAVIAAAEAALGALACAIAALALLGLPVVLNNVPDPRWTIPAAAGLGLGGALGAAASLSPMPSWPAAVASCAGVAFLLAALAPLRRPRRECPPGEDS